MFCVSKVLLADGQSVCADWQSSCADWQSGCADWQTDHAGWQCMCAYWPPDLSAEGLPPSRLVQLTNHLLLGSFAGLRVAGQAAFWAHARIRRQWQDGSHFPLQVRTDCGQVMTIDAVSLTSR